jgi:transcriptional regulator with XRE-family HTH domain
VGGASLQPLLGQRLREVRRARQLTLTEVAAATGISASSLSLVETGQNEPTIGRLARLCTLYEISVTELLPAASAGPAGATLPFAGEGLTVIVADTSPDARMLPVSLRFEPGGRFAEQVVTGSDVFLVVTEGTLEVSVAGEDDRTLRPGEWLYLPLGRPHRYRNASNEHPAQAVGVVSPPVPVHTA